MRQGRLVEQASRRLLRRWQLRPGRESIDVRSLISPLRYDVVVRRELFVDLRDSSVSAVLESPDGAYWAWFKHVECERFFPELLSNPDQLRQRYRMRVEGAARTLASFERGGFDARYPVTLLSTAEASTTDAGAFVHKPCHIADGCHRLALLLLHERPLEAWMYRVRPATGALIDNTAVLLRHLEITEPAYARFLSHGYTARSCSSIAELHDVVAAEAPSRLAELDQVLRSHGRRPGPTEGAN